MADEAVVFLDKRADSAIPNYLSDLFIFLLLAILRFIVWDYLDQFRKCTALCNIESLAFQRHSALSHRGPRNADTENTRCTRTLSDAEFAFWRYVSHSCGVQRLKKCDICYLISTTTLLRRFFATRQRRWRIIISCVPEKGKINE